MNSTKPPEWDLTEGAVWTVLNDQHGRAQRKVRKLAKKLQEAEARLALVSAAIVGLNALREKAAGVRKRGAALRG